MKKLLFIILLLPVYCSAQSELLGKSRATIRAQLKIVNIFLVDNNSLYGATYSDTFKTNDGELICGFDKHKTCTEVIKMMKLSIQDSVKNQFNINLDKKDGETFAEDVWADKSKTFKVHLYTGLGMIYMDYLPYNKSYVIH